MQRELNLKLFSKAVYFWIVFFFFKRLNTQLLKSTVKLEKNENEIAGVGAENQGYKQLRISGWFCGFRLYGSQ